MSKEPADRCEVVFRGHVQGVGFRHTTCVVASRYPVSGYVLNQMDGTVRMVAEGRRADVSMLIQDVLRAMAGLATSHTEQWGAATGEFRGFEVRSIGP